MRKTIDPRRRAEPAGGGRGEALLSGEGLRQEDGGAGVDGPVSVQDGLGHLAERPIGAAHGLVAHERIEVAGGGCGLLDDAGRLPGGGQVGGDVDELGRTDQVGADGVHDGLEVIGSPRLGDVMRAVVVGDDARPVVGGAAGNGVADADATADAGDEHRPARQGQPVAASGAALVVGVVLTVSLGGHGSECRRGGAGGPAVSVLDAREPAGEGLAVGP